MKLKSPGINSCGRGAAALGRGRSQRLLHSPDTAAPHGNLLCCSSGLLPHAAVLLPQLFLPPLEAVLLFICSGFCWGRIPWHRYQGVAKYFSTVTQNCSWPLCWDLVPAESAPPVSDQLQPHVTVTHLSEAICLSLLLLTSFTTAEFYNSMVGDHNLE